MDAFECHGAELELDALLHRQPMELVTHPVSDASPGRKSQNESSGRSQHRLEIVHKTERSVSKYAITVIQSTVHHRANQRVGRFKSQRPTNKSQLANMEVGD
jgi:hypothetical protein